MLPRLPSAQSLYDKGPDAIPPPKTIFTRESLAMGHFDVNPSASEARPVPASPHEYVAARTRYNERMSALRKELTSAWAARRQREQAAVLEFQEGVRTRRAENDAVRERRRVARAVETAKQVALARESRALRVAESERANARRTAALDARRVAWLDALEADAAGWVTLEKVDEVR